MPKWGKKNSAPRPALPEMVTFWKSTPVMTEEERLETARACRWVDEGIMQRVPTGEPGFLEQHRIDFVVHGDGALPLARPHV